MADKPYPIRGLGDWWNELRQYVNDRPTESKIVDEITDPGSEIGGALNAAIAQGRPFHFLNAYDDFFAGRMWVAGQSNTPTTLTAAVAAGATVLPVASATGIIAGQHLIVSEATAQQAIYTVLSVSGNDVTITAPTAHALASGAGVGPLWVNRDHPTAAGYKAYAYWVVNAKDRAGEYVITGTAPKVTFLGNSWVFNSPTSYSAALTARIPGATAVMKGVGGHGSTEFLARFAADVPTDSDYVIFNEPSVNDLESGGGVGISTQAQVENLAELVRRIRAIGAIPIYVGYVPLEWMPGRSKAAVEAIKRIIGDGTAFPGTAPAAAFSTYAVTPNAGSIGVGLNTLRDLPPTNLGNVTAFGVNVFPRLTTGTGNTGVGTQVGWVLTTGSYNTATGSQALFGLTTGGNNTADGGSAGYGLTTGSNNFFGGYQAGYAPAGATANATTTGSGNVYLGWRSGGGPANSNAVAIGGGAVVSGTNSAGVGANVSLTADHTTGLGAGVVVAHSGGVGIGRDNAGGAASTTAINEIALGTALHTTRIAGKLRVAPRTGLATTSAGSPGEITVDDGYIYVCTATNTWKRAALATW